MFIGVLDSGLGGLSVERRIRERLPQAAIEFVADQAHAPYGDKPLAEIRTRAIAIAAPNPHAVARYPPPDIARPTDRNSLDALISQR